MVSYPVSDLQLVVLSYSDQSTYNCKSEEDEDEELVENGDMAGD